MLIFLFSRNDLEYDWMKWIWIRNISGIFLFDHVVVVRFAGVGARRYEFFDDFWGPFPVSLG
jgi:hypothetical protein